MGVSVNAKQIGGLTRAWFPLFHHAVQAQLWRCKKRFVAVPAGRGSGKTEISKRKLVMELARPKPWDDPRYFYGAPTEAQAVRIAWRHFQKLIPKNWIRNIVSTPMHRIETIFGSELYVVGLDKPQRIEGDQWDGCVLDESCDLKPKVFDLNVLPMLNHRDGWCWRIGVPKRQGPSAAEFRDFYEEAITGAIEDQAGFRWPATDILTASQLRYAMETMDPKDFNEQIMAEFETAGGGIFYAFDREHNCRPCEYRRDLPLIVGMDFNVDPMAWVIGHYYLENKTFEWFDEIWIRDTNTPKCLKILANRYAKHRGGIRLYPDAASRQRKTSAARSDIQLIQNHRGLKGIGRTIHCRRDNPPVDDRFAACNAKFCNAAGQHRMFVDPTGCPKLTRDLETRHYKPGSREVADKKEQGHPSDAMGYAVFRISPLKVKLELPAGPVITKKGAA